MNRSDRPPDDKTNPQAGLTQEQLDEFVANKLGATVNNMLTARFGTFEKKMKESLGGMLGETLKAQLPDLLKELRPATPDEPTDGGKGNKGGKKQDDPEIATLRQQMAALAQKSAEQEARNLALREKARTQAIREQARNMLGKYGIENERFDAAYALLDHSGKIAKAEDIESDDGFFRRSNAEDPIALEVGLTDWVKNDPMAKLFLPASGTRGSGSRPGSRPGTGGPLTDAQIRANIAAELEREVGR